MRPFDADRHQPKKQTKISTVKCKIDIFGLSILFSQYRSCDDTHESIFFQSWTFSCSHGIFLKTDTTKAQTSQVSSHDLYWENKTDEQKRSIIIFILKERISIMSRKQWFFIFCLVFHFKISLHLSANQGVRNSLASAPCAGRHEFASSCDWLMKFPASLVKFLLVYHQKLCKFIQVMQFSD